MIWVAPPQVIEGLVSLSSLSHDNYMPFSPEIEDFPALPNAH
jgi:hypothetical protein